jgi:hypothetical protein
VISKVPAILSTPPKIRWHLLFALRESNFHLDVPMEEKATQYEVAFFVTPQATSSFVLTKCDKFEHCYFSSQ